MKISLIAGAVVVAIVTGIILLSNAGPNTATSPSQTANINITNELAGGAKLVDVRTPQEYSAGHIQGATNTPLGEIQSGTMPNNDKTSKLYVYCRSGSRSAQATSLLKQAGYTNVIDLGAMSDVVALGGKATN